MSGTIIPIAECGQLNSLSQIIQQITYQDAEGNFGIGTFDLNSDTASTIMTFQQLVILADGVNTITHNLGIDANFASFIESASGLNSFFGWSNVDENSITVLNNSGAPITCIVTIISI